MDEGEPFIPMSDLERRLEKARVRAGLALAPILFLGILVWPIDVLRDKPEAHRLAAVMAAVITLWISEALPMPVTALLGAAACALLKIADARTIFAPFADQL